MVCAELHITPDPDSILRVYKAIDKPVEVPVQALQTFDREDFAVVEWGGAEVR